MGQCSTVRLAVFPELQQTEQLLGSSVLSYSAQRWYGTVQSLMHALQLEVMIMMAVRVAVRAHAVRFRHDVDVHGQGPYMGAVLSRACRDEEAPCSRCT